MPMTSDKRVSVSNDSAPKSPALYLWKVEAAGHPSSARCSWTVSSQAAAMLKKVRSAGPESLRRTDGSGRTPSAGDSIYGYHSIYMDITRESRITEAGRTGCAASAGSAGPPAAARPQEL